MTSPAPNNNDLRVWWIAQLGTPTFHVQVKTIDEAILLLNTLAEYDQHQLKHRIKPDYSNVGGLEVWDGDLAKDSEDGNGWCEWTNEDGESIDEVISSEDAYPSNVPFVKA